ncbi:MAG TPA: penicillin-binding protein 2 [Candidatus Saccharimonadales bacterium]|nr:penicillin-binding protein 2 [Candidatus Saccharimonadales bacterium]
MLGRSDSRPRHLLVLATLLLVSIALIGRLAFWQVVERQHLATLARQQSTVTAAQPSHRGTIYDRTGTVVLATTVDRNRLIGAPAELSPDQRAAVAAQLVTLLGLTGDAATQLTANMNSDRGYVILAAGLDEATAQKIRDGLADGSLGGLSLESQPVRVYPQAGGAPNTSLAAQLLGFVNAGGTGQYGVEQYYQDVLSGTPRVVVADRTTTGISVNNGSQVLDSGSPGADLTLTLDAGLQLAVEQELLAAWVADRAVSVSAVVMDPYTGAIYAEASYPSYDANNYQATATTNPARFMDPVISEIYEPGSVFKLPTAVAALEKKVVTPTTPIYDSGTLRLDNGQTHVSDADLRAMGVIAFQDVIAYSRNVGAARVALMLGHTTKAASIVLYDTWQKLGFGKPTGIDLAGEVAGITNDPRVRAWQQIDLANGSFGQGVAVTSIQLATAYSAMVNGGLKVQPHVVSAIGDHVETPAPGVRLMPAKISSTLIGLMKHVVLAVPFYRDRTLVPGYDVGGKTGTAQIWDAKLNGGRGAWKANIFNYTFVGFIGRNSPQLIIAVEIHEGTPTVNRQGDIELPVESFELFRRIATDAISTTDLPLGTPRQTASR